MRDYTRRPIKLNMLFDNWSSQPEPFLIFSSSLSFVSTNVWWPGHWNTQNLSDLTMYDSWCIYIAGTNTLNISLSTPKIPHLWRLGRVSLSIQTTKNCPEEESYLFLGAKILKVLLFEFFAQHLTAVPHQHDLLEILSPTTTPNVTKKLGVSTKNVRTVV